MGNKKTLDELRALLKYHIQTNSNMVGHLSMLEPTSVRLNSFVDHIMGSVNLFPPSPLDTLFYKRLYEEVEGMARDTLCEAIQEHTIVRNHRYDKIKGVL